MYTIVTMIIVKRVADKNAFKECFNCFNCSFNLLLGKLCCSVVKHNKIRVRYKWKENCKLRYPSAVLIFSKIIPQQLSMIFTKLNAYIYNISSYTCSCIC